jgi:hypothetical protein
VRPGKGAANGGQCPAPIIGGTSKFKRRRVAR